MKIGVPGEFHEDRWQRTAEDLREACAHAHTGSGRSPSDTSYRVAKRSSIRHSARQTCPQVPQRHHPVAVKPVIYLCLSMKLAFFMDIEVLTGCLSMKLAFFMDIEVWIGSLAIKPAFIIADEVRQGGRTVLQARRPTHNYPRGDPGRGGNAHFADNPCLFTGKMVYLRPHNFRAG